MPVEHDYQDDKRLISRSLAGDRGAFRQLFEHYAPVVYRVVYRMLGNEDDAADLTQDIFVRVFERLHTIRDGQAFQAWVTRMAVNLAHDCLRRKPRVPLSLDAPLPGVDGEQEWQIADEAPDQVDRLLGDERAARVQAALSALSHEHRAVVVLHHLEGMAVEEIGQVLGIPAGTVKSRLARARAELRRRLEGYFEE